MPAYTPTDPGRPFAVNVVSGEITVDAVSLEAGSASIGSVDVNGPTAAFTVAAKTDLSNATPFNLASNAGLKMGIRITNLETTAGNIIYVGDSAVTATRFIVPIYPGQTSDWLPCANSNIYYLIAAVNNSDFTYGGC